MALMTYRQGGFTLIEVMIALLIVAFGITAIITATNNYIAAQVDIERKMLSNWAASNALADLRYDAKINKISANTKRKNIRLGGYEWRVLTKATPTDVERVHKVVITVHAIEDQKKRVLAEITSAVAEHR